MRDDLARVDTGVLRRVLQSLGALDLDVDDDSGHNVQGRAHHGVEGEDDNEDLGGVSPNSEEECREEGKMKRMMLNGRT